MSIRLNESEMTSVADMASKLGISSSEYIRTLALNDKSYIRVPPLVPEINFELYRRLVTACSNLNLIASSIDKSNDTSKEKVASIIKNLDHQIRDVCLMLRGSNG